MAIDFGPPAGGSNGACSPTVPFVSEIEFRQLRSVVRWNRAFMVVAAVIMVGWSVSAVTQGYWFWLPIGVALLFMVAVVIVRTERVGIIVEDDELRVRNFFREHRLSRVEIEVFSVATDPFFFRREGLLIQMSDGRFLRPAVMRPIRGVATRPDLVCCQRILSQWRLAADGVDE